MQVDFSKLGADAYGKSETPSMILRKPHGEIIGYLGRYFDDAAEFKFTDVSTVQFSYPKYDNGDLVPFYDELVKDKLVEIEPYGIFVVASAEEENDGIRAVKSVQLYSREYELASKQVVFAEGTYNLWNPADQENTLLYMVLTESRNWKVGYVSPALIGRYRTFDQTDAAALEFLQGTVQESYGCYFLFDTYNRTVNAIDVDDTVPQLPIYLSYVNLLKNGQIKELEDDFKTRYYVQGADGVDIRSVNPTGDNYIVNLDYAIGNGDLPAALAQKWISWQNAIFAKQPYYTSLVALRNTALSRQLTEQARLVDLQNALATLDNERATFVQMQNTVSKGSDTWNYFEQRLTDTATEYSNLEDKIAAQKVLLEEIKDEIDLHAADIASVNSELKMSKYFTQNELDVLDVYLKDGSFVDETFAVFDVDVDAGDTYSNIGNANVQFFDVKWTDVECDGGHRMAAISGGSIKITGTNYSLSGAIISGTVDHKDNDVVASFYLGTGTANGEDFPSGNLTCVCNSSYTDADILAWMDKHEDVMSNADGSVTHTMYYYTGDTEFDATGAVFYFTRNVTEYQKYSVYQDLYDYASARIKEISSPTYEFEVESGNILYAKDFEPFKNALQLGCKCYLDLDDGMLLTPILIEVNFSFRDPTKFSLVFANQFRRPSAVNTMKDIIKDAATTTRSFDSAKLKFGENNNTTAWVKNLIQAGYDAALMQIQAGKDNAVTIDKAGITITSVDGVDAIKLNNGMIALLDRRTNTVKMAMGHFLNEASGTDFIGILADIIGGILIAGQNLIIECPDPNGGVMQFKVDSSGVILNNGRMYMRTDKGAMGWDANHGFFAGTTDLFQSTENGFVSPICVDSSGNLILDSYGFPKDTNVWIGIDGKVYFRGNVYATDGVFNGTVYAKDGKFTGQIEATSGTFTGTIKAATLDGTLVGGSNGGALEGISLNIGNGNYVVDSSGNVVMKGNINLSGGKITWGSNGPVQYQFSVNGTSGWHSTMTASDKYRRDSLDGGVTWGSPYQFVGTDGKNGSDGSDANVTFNNMLSALQKAASTKTTFITADDVGAPTIYGAKIYGAEIYAGGVNDKGGQIIGLTDSGIEIWSGSGYRVLTIEGSKNNASMYTGLNSLDVSAPYMTLGISNTLYFSGLYVDFTGVMNGIDFTGVPITGLHATWG